MQPITNDQDSTLRRWITTKGKRRLGKGDKKFLCIEKGLSEEQIDWWWEKNVSSKHDSNVSTPNSAYKLHHAIQPDISHSGIARGIQDMNQIPFPGTPSGYLEPQPMDLDLDMSLNMGVNMFAPSQMENWTQIENTIQDDTVPLPSPLNFSNSQRDDSWSSTTARSDGRYLRTSTSTIGSVPGLSPSGGSRSSYSSSLWTMDTASTTNSVYNPSWAMVEDVKLSTSQTLGPVKLNKRLPACPPTLNYYCDSIVEEEDFNRFQPGLDHVVSNMHPLGRSPIPRESAKLPVFYPCTVCHTYLQRKDDWRRHEELHDHQKFWICMQSFPAGQVEDGWKCDLCGILKPNHEEMEDHLVNAHNINECIGRDAANQKKWPRKDKLKQHLQQVHNLGDGSTGSWENWWRASRRKKAWGCGYCGIYILTWKDRSSHIADHYAKQGLVSDQWSFTLIVKGLLQQSEPEFNVSAAWKARFPNGDSELYWSQANAKILKKKLEYHEGTPRDIAAEAQRLASKLSGGFGNPGWNSTGAVYQET